MAGLAGLAGLAGPTGLAGRARWQGWLAGLAGQAGLPSSLGSPPPSPPPKFGFPLFLNDVVFLDGGEGGSTSLLENSLCFVFHWFSLYFLWPNLFFVFFPLVF